MALRRAAALCGFASLIAATVPAAAQADPPPGRAYELVSPADKPSGATATSSRTGGVPIPARSADIGERLVYGMTSNVANSPSAAPNPLVFGERTATGWRSRTAVRSADDGNTAVEVSRGEARAAWMTRDGTELVFGIGMSLGGFSSGAVISQIYRTTDSEAAPSWLSSPTGGILPAGGISSLSLSAGDDTRNVVFDSTVPLVPDAAGTTRGVYAFRDGALQIVSRLPTDAVAPLAGLANSRGPLNGPNTPSRTKRNEVAGSGRFVLFSTGASTNEAPLYVRDLELGVTRQLAGGGGTQPDRALGLDSAAGGPGIATVPNGVVFGAREVGRAYFRGLIGPNIPGADAGMYEADLLTGAVTKRSAITGAPLQVSPDGQRMVFLTPPAGGVRQLRYWDRATPTASALVAEIDGGIANWGYARVFAPSSDGRTWVFLAPGSADADRPNVAPNTRQLYRWTVGESKPTCLTCEPLDGVARTSGVNLAVQDGGFSETLVDPAKAIQPGDDAAFFSQEGHGLSEDGRWVLFDSPDQLVDEDQNEVRDVYLWDRDGGPNGQLQLVTSGQGNEPSWALDLSPDGTNAFFSTREGLVPADSDGALDVYTARIGGGFPDRPDESCAGTACRPAVIPPPVALAVATNVLTSPSEGARTRVQSGMPKLRVRSVRSSRSRVTVKVVTPKAGRIRISGSWVKSTSRTAKRQTTYTLRVPLTASAKRLVERGRKVKVKLRVAFTPQGSKKASTARASVSVRKGR